MAKIRLATKPTLVSYEAIRNLTSPEEQSRGARTYFANILASEALKFATTENLREYIPDHPGKKRNAVHKQISETIANRPEMFISLNSGFTVTAEDVTVDDKKKTVSLRGASLINGAQSQGEIRRYFESLGDELTREDDFHVRVELCIEADHDSTTDIAIARNTSTNVQQVSIAGKRGLFEDLERSLQRVFPKNRIRRSETDTDPSFIDPLKLLQICTVLKPTELLGDQPSAHSKLKAYKNRAKCLEEFHTAWINRERKDSEGVSARRLYDFLVQIAPFAWKEYLHWRHHEGWHGQYLKERTKAVQRENGQHTVADGIVFPIMSAISVFVKYTEKTGWSIEKPSVFDDLELIETAREQLKFKQGNPVLMGRDIQVYENLMQVPKTVLRVITRLMETGEV